MQDAKSVRTAARRVTKAKERLDAEQAAFQTVIREAHTEGMTLRAIAAASGLSFGRIHQIASH